MSKFSIILPVRNGGHYVKECVNSILTQTYPHFNLIVLDNASTDGTLEWISSLKDERIIIHPSSASLSIEKNWARIVGVPKNEFMTCIGHDDILLPGYLDEMNDLISQYPDAALYQTHFSFIDAEGNTIRPCKRVDKIQSPGDFLSGILSMTIDVNGTGFMTRSADYDGMGGIPAYPNLLFADFNLWIELAKRSYKVTSPNNCFSYRLHQSMTTTSTDDKFQASFEQLAGYLLTLKQNDPEFNTVINRHVKDYIGFYCKSFAHRLLRTEFNMRNNMTVYEWARRCNEMLNLLKDNNRFKPSSMASVQLARIIDSNIVSRNLFLVFKKLFPKPLLK